MFFVQLWPDWTNPESALYSLPEVPIVWQLAAPSTASVVAGVLYARD